MTRNPMLTPEQEKILREVLFPESEMHFDRVARINAPLLIDNGIPLRDGNGYRHPKLGEGANVIRGYLRDIAKDYGLLPEKDAS